MQLKRIELVLVTLVVMLVFLCSLPKIANGADNLVANGGFEKLEDEDVPMDWEFSPDNFGELKIDKVVKAEGKNSVNILQKANSDQSTFSILQTEKFEVKRDKTHFVSYKLRSEGLCFGTNPENPGALGPDSIYLKLIFSFFDENDNPVKQEEYYHYTDYLDFKREKFEVKIPENVTQAFVQFLFINGSKNKTGKIWLDDVQVIAFE